MRNVQYRWFVVPHLLALVLGVVLVSVSSRQGEASVYGWVLIAGSVLFAFAYLATSFRARSKADTGRQDDV